MFLRLFLAITHGKHLNEFEGIVEYLLKAFYDVNQRCLEIFSHCLLVQFHLSYTAVPEMLSFCEASVK